jgi:hypothetical protein
MTARLRALETLLLTAAAVLAADALGRSDGSPLGAALPWLALVPVVIGLQHGLWFALASAVALGVWACAYGAWVAGVPASSLGCACCVMAAAAGLARDAQREKWERLRARVLQLEAAGAREKASRQLLQLSHARLLEKLAGASRGLQAAVDRALERLHAMDDFGAFGRLLLELLAEHAELESGVVYAVGAGFEILEPRIASFGDVVGVPSGGGPLADRAARTRCIVSVVDIDDGRDGAHGAVLAALPLLAADEKVLGVLAMTRLPFSAFHPAALREAFVVVSRICAEVNRDQVERWMRHSPTSTAVRVERAVLRPQSRWGFIR